MQNRACLVSYHEIALKGRNRLTFERRLQKNLEASLSSLQAPAPRRIAGHLLVDIDDDSRIDEIARAIAQTPGVVKVALAWSCEQNLASICETAKLALFDNNGFKTFKVAAKHRNTQYPVHSMELNREVGSALCDAAPDAKVRMDDPDVTVNVLVEQGDAYVWSREIHGAGGLPVGSAGRVVSLMSAGIDSPVATWSIVHRGAVAICVHFSGRPQTSDSSELLAKEIIEQLRPAAGIAKLYVAPIGDYQRKISLECQPRLRVIMYRRLMIAVACKIAEIEGAEALVTGESLGQVASQTLPNIRATDDVATLPVFRPLIGSDKLDIMDKARELGTYDISIRNTSDCCTLFMPRNPETHANLEEVRKAWDSLPTAQWVDEIVDAAEVQEFYCPAYAPSARRDLKNARQ